MGDLTIKRCRSSGAGNQKGRKRSWLKTGQTLSKKPWVQIHTRAALTMGRTEKIAPCFGLLMKGGESGPHPFIKRKKEKGGYLRRKPLKSRKKDIRLSSRVFGTGN